MRGTGDKGGNQELSEEFGGEGRGMRFAEGDVQWGPAQDSPADEEQDVLSVDLLR